MSSSVRLQLLEEVVRQLLPLGFSRSVILRELAHAESGTDIATLKEILARRMTGQKPERNGKGMLLKSIQVYMQLILMLESFDHSHHHDTCRSSWVQLTRVL